ncbi:Muskelin N-terminus-domain-containing protein [Crepidotus variabilis]|uniref:Muskelin N-terminus-domain-containing protein n=1 Tax=Crepidotus variabilis TaxID=179855 RepID=A0A9P6ECS3_9AGAR|nr:Muskelin N-terminus-domain-containing protein [Crepidotus variabilis]
MSGDSSLPLMPPSSSLTYSIASSTPHSGKYAPENVIEDKPNDHSSRWSASFRGYGQQWITLKLESLSVLKTITFGKYAKSHPCNIKELQVLVGPSEDHMTEILHANLKDDSIPETFTLTHMNSAGVPFPTRFIKIVPIMTHQQNFHVSIWYIGLTGVVDPEYVERVRLTHEEYRETAVLRYVLKHLRQRRLLSPYQSILSRSSVHLEHPLITKLHESIVLQGDWKLAEQHLQQLATSGLLDTHLSTCQRYAEWTRLRGTDADGDIPPPRGGHAMCMDPVNEMVYLFGGWDGEKSLDDFWVYSVKEDTWKLLSSATTLEPNAPGARSCHKMTFDTKTGSIYVLGRLGDMDGLRAPSSPDSATSPRSPDTRGPLQLPSQGHRTSHSDGAEPGGQINTFCSEFYRYHTRGLLAGKWDFLSIDTAASGGPPLVFDHQMAIDSDSHILYVFGGRVVDGNWDVFKYSGLYSYNISTSKWKLLQNAPTSSSPSPTISGTTPAALSDIQGHLRHGHSPVPIQTSAESSGTAFIPPRYGHSMVLDQFTKTLYIFAGKRNNDDFLADMYSYDIRTGSSTEIFSNFTTAGGPGASSTQRAAIDPTLKEIYVFSGLTRDSDQIGTTKLRDTLNWVYRYDTRPGEWMQVLKMPGSAASERPRPRFGHQVVYNTTTRTVFFHGGNGGQGAGLGENGERLDDFWRMELKRPGPEEIIRQSKFLIRKQQFREMCEDMPPVKALNFLQKDVSSVVNHKNRDEERQFRALLTHLLSPIKSPPPEPLPTKTPFTRRVTTGDLSVNFPALKREDTREGSPRPKKRSRPEKDKDVDPDAESTVSVMSAKSSSSEESGVWTNEIPADLPVDENAPALDGKSPPSSATSSTFEARHLREVVDPIESNIRGEDAQKERPLSGTRYTERTEVFEALLKFVDEGERQPKESLLDLVDFA